MKQVTQAVILAGGTGVRLRPFTLATPKPMIEINGKPFLAYLIENLKENNIKEVLILVGYLHEKIENYFGDGSKFGMTITYSYSSPETDTGSRLQSALPLLHETFLLLYGDNIWSLDLKKLQESYVKNKKDAQMTVYTNRFNTTKNNVSVQNNTISVYSKERNAKNLNGVNIGYFILKKNILKNLPKENFSFDEIISRLVKKQQLSAFLTDHSYYSLTSPERLPKVTQYLSNKKVVFLDRDGVINQKAPKAEYITSWKDFVFLPKVKEAIQLLHKKGYDIYIITNQSGIARNMVTEETINIIHKNIVKECKKIGVEIKHIYMCPHGWDEGCWCRKPNPGMLFQAASDYAVNLHKSIFIGDDIRDKQAGNAAGCTTYLVSPRENLFHIVQKYL